MINQKLNKRTLLHLHFNSVFDCTYFLRLRMIDRIAWDHVIKQNSLITQLVQF